MRALIASILLTFCAAAMGQSAWDAEQILAYRTARVRLDSPNGGSQIVDSAQVATAVIALKRISGVAGVTAKLYLVEGSEFKAFVGGGLPSGVIGLSLGALTTLAYKADRMAMVVAHELAHVRLGHVAGATVRNGVIELISTLLGAAVEVRTGVPLGGAINATAGRAVAAAHDRSQESEADALAIDWMRMAGYDPQGAIDALEDLPASSSWFATHPSGPERVAAARRQLASPPGSAVSRLPVAVDPQQATSASP